MNYLRKKDRTTLIALLGGLVSCILRVWLYATQVDGKGFLVRGSLPEILCWIVTAVVLILLVFAARKLPREVDYESTFPAFIPGALCCVAAAVGIAVSLLKSPAIMPDVLGYITRVVGWASAASLLALAWYRLKGKQPFFLFHSVLTVYFMLYLISQYRFWSASPKTQDYLLLLLALLALMVATYHRAALAVDNGSFRVYRFFSGSALYFSCAALFSAEIDAYLFYLTMALWVLADNGWVKEQE